MCWCRCWELCRTFRSSEYTSSIYEEPANIPSPLTILTLASSALLTALIAIYLDSSFYMHAKSTFTLLNFGLVITPINNLLYNSSAANLSQHGIHAFYTHFLANLPQLLGPVVLLLPFPTYTRLSTPLISALSGTAFLSLLPHQEVRFLLPAVPLILVSTSIPSTRTRQGKIWIFSWLFFNIIYGILMGFYHQGGVIPAQFHLAKGKEPITALWWKTYSPPTWVLGSASGRIQTVDLMGMAKPKLHERLLEVAKPCKENTTENVLVAPYSATYLDRFLGEDKDISLERIYYYPKHLHLDDLDFGDDGVVPTLQRVIGRRGIAIWRICRIGTAKKEKKRGVL